MLLPTNAGAYRLAPPKATGTGGGGGGEVTFDFDVDSIAAILLPRNAGD